VRTLLCADVLAELGGRPASARDLRPWSRLLDSDLPGGAGGGGATLKGTIEGKMVEPLLALAAADPLGRPRLAGGGGAGGGVSGGADFAALAGAASYSAILFGPPGTAKTTVVAAIAARLGWGLVTVDTSTFLSAGLSNVAARISEVFELLLQLQDVVVLFDEVEEFALDRTNPALAMESRMLTTAMLTKLADLRGARRVAFFIATNRRPFDRSNSYLKHATSSCEQRLLTPPGSPRSTLPSRALAASTCSSSSALPTSTRGCSGSECGWTPLWRPALWTSRRRARRRNNSSRSSLRSGRERRSSSLIWRRRSWLRTPSRPPSREPRRAATRRRWRGRTARCSRRRRP